MTNSPRRSGRPSAITALGMTGAPGAAAPITPPAPSGPATSLTPRPRDVTDPATPHRVPASQPTISYTLRLTPDEALAADELTMTARRTTGRRMERSDLIRALLALATQDPALLARACDTVTPRRT